ncbi:MULTISPECIES: RteC domain-containing protein [Flavobacteriaceae]|uniref:RteC protein n=2 Tax=Flavobacteriaceae TaxID=49546 RepID=A0A4Y8AT67_9FLAO|nr:MULTISPECIES: RteC domain-containing protein [Flavobacteriaceae]TEW75067.1 hypothetical protein E2488_05960 [Gramella jeungdoensis]GGK41925.1 hypothetical protein GCM10007963_07360 [Lutibacter litoralis]
MKQIDIKAHYYDLLDDYLKDYPNSNEKEFIKNEIDFYEDFVKEFEEMPFEKLYDNEYSKEKQLIEYKKYLNYFKDKLRTLHKSETLVNDVNKITDNNILQWYGSKSELIELTKALIENGNLKGKQEDIFNTIQKIFNIKLNNIDQAITKFNSRNQENETKFLDSLKSSLSKYIKTKLEKNR